MGTRFRRFGRASTTLLAAATFTATLTAIPAGAAVGNPSDLVEGCEDAPSASGIFNDYQTLSARQKVVVDCLSSGYKGDKDDSDFVLQGSGSGTARRVNFDQTITRQQFAAILNRVGDYLGLDAASGNPNDPTFADVTSNMFFFNEIEELYARGLTTGKGPDTQDVDNDGDTQELVYDPFGDVTYGQVLAFVYRLLAGPDGAGEQLATNQSRGQANSLDCGFFDDEKQLLDNAGFLITSNTPSDCRAPAPRGLVFDLIAVSFDETVESGLADNPFDSGFGSIALSTDTDQATVGQTITATVTVLDTDDNPVQGQRVEIFGVAPDDAFESDGDPKDPGNLSVNGSGGHGTGTTPATLDTSDPTTNAQGKVSVSIALADGTASAFDLYAFQGEVGDAYVDVKDRDEQVSSKVTVRFELPPTAIEITSTANQGELYGTAHVVTFQMVDENGDPVAAEGLNLFAEQYRNDDCAGIPEPTDGDCDGSGEPRFAFTSLSTDANGRATWSRPGATDPQPSTSGDPEDPNNTGDVTTDRFTASWDENNNQSAGDDEVQDTGDLFIEFRDAGNGSPQSATMRFTSSNNPNKTDETGLTEGAQAVIEVTVSDIFGNGLENVLVRFYRSTNGATSESVGTATTGGNGLATFPVSGGAAGSEWDYEVYVDGDQDAIASRLDPDDFSAQSSTGDDDVTVHWVRDAVTGESTTLQDVVGHQIGGSNYVDMDTGRRFFFRATDTYLLNNAPSTFEDFKAALANDPGSNDVLSISQYAPGSANPAIFNYFVNGGGGGVGLP